MSTPFEWALLAVSATATTASVVQGQQAAKQNEKAQEAQEGLAEIENRRSRVKMIKQAQVERARIENQAAAEGLTASSGFGGASTSLGTQVASNQADFSSSLGLQQDTSRALVKAGNAQASGQLASGIASIATNAFYAGGGMKNLQAKYPKFFGTS